MACILPNGYDWTLHQTADEDRVYGQNRVHVSEPYLSSGISVLVVDIRAAIDHLLQARGMWLENTRTSTDVDIMGSQEPDALEGVWVLEVNSDVKFQCSRILAWETCLRHF